jgi:hypothetical protein
MLQKAKLKRRTKSRPMRRIAREMGASNRDEKPL